MMKNYIKYLSLAWLVALLTFIDAPAQRLKYKDIFETIAAGDYNPDIVLTQLKEHKQQEPEEGNQYYQLGRIYYERTKRFDVLKQNNGALQVADSAIHYLTMSKKVIDDKEVKRKDEFYREFAKDPKDPKSEVTIKMVFTRIDKYINEMNAFKTNIKKIHTDFNAAVDNYNIANATFIEIYGQFATYKEMSLLAKQEFLKKVDLMKFHFDEGVALLKQYQEDIKAYPIEVYKQEFKLAPILNYRLHGITKANFLENNITLWDYGQWHAEINKYLDSEIKPFRQLIIDNEKALNDKIATMGKSSVPLEDEYRIQSDILMMIRKYDPASFLVDIFEYKQARVNMLNTEVLKIDPTDFDKRASRYATSMYHARSGLQSLKHAEQNIADISLKRHEDFLGTYYKKGVPAFIDAERKKVTPNLAFAEGELKNELINRREVKGATKAFGPSGVDEGTIPLFVTAVEGNQAMADDYVTADIFQNKNYVYASGYQQSEMAKKPFIAFYRNDSLKWVLKPNIAEGVEAEVLAVTSLGLGGACLMYSYPMGNKAAGETYIVEFNNTGKEILRTKVANRKYPVELIYTPADNLFGCVFTDFGSRGDNMAKTLYVSKVDQEGKAQWETGVSVTGSLAALTPFKDSFVMTCNVQKAQDRDGKAIGSGPAIFSILVSPKGELGEHFLSEVGGPSYASYVINNQDRQINIFGFKGQPDSAPLDGKQMIVLWLNGELFPMDSTLE